MDRLTRRLLLVVGGLLLATSGLAAYAQSNAGSPAPASAPVSVPQEQETGSQPSMSQPSAQPVTVDPQVSRGQALFVGTLDLHGRIRTHLVDLPPQVVVCGHCHAAGDGPAVPRSLAPRLTRELLLAPRARRGGPVTIYNAARFCTLLRQGVDPGYVMLSLEMPIYSLDDSDCRALWQFVMRERA